MIKMVLCTDAYGALGYKNDLIYHISKDLKRFKKLTLGQIILMGRNTLESLPNQYLPNRINTVLTHNLDYKPSDSRVFVAHDYETVINQYLTGKQDKDLVIIGGETLYEGIPIYADVIHHTLVFDEAKNVDTSVDMDDILGLHFDYGLHRPKYVAYKTETMFDDDSQLFYQFTDYVLFDKLKEYHEKEVSQ